MGTTGKMLPKRSRFASDEFIGKRFGTRVVTSHSPVNKGGGRSHAWIMQCDCGRIDTVAATLAARGRANSCVRCSVGVARGEGSPAWRGVGAVTGTAYRHIVTQAERRGIEISITIEDIDRLYEKQNGKCALTGDDIHFFRGIRYGRGNASVDRIDSAKGYVLSNVHLVTGDINFAKQSMSLSDFIAMCARVVSHNQSTYFDRAAA